MNCWKFTRIRESAEAGQLVREWIAAEIWSRSFFSDILRNAKEGLQRIYVCWKYRGILNIVRDTAILLPKSGKAHSSRKRALFEILKGGGGDVKKD